MTKKETKDKDLRKLTIKRLTRGQLARLSGGGGGWHCSGANTGEQVCSGSLSSSGPCAP